ncbi:MAG: MotA/TolQ/ExbB proton channel family protein [Kangiellaceae bacterium]|nr:MotA/TolQ/ExbB proton channel family protein [Kangiellaceae bacterium]
MSNFQSIFSNIIVWLILLTALACYTLLIELLVHKNKNLQWIAKVSSWKDSLQVMLNCLPLLGLFGTIVGLLRTFTQMSYGSMDQQELLSSGIADAMFTTQIGLVMVIPGWLLHAYLKHHHRGIEANQNQRLLRGDEICAPG